MSYNRFIHVSKERHAVLSERFKYFVDNLDNMDVKPISMFDPPSKEQMEELKLIRELSKDLQKKKDEDLKKAARQEEEAKAAAKAASEKAAEDAKENASEKVNGTEEVSAST